MPICDVCFRQCKLEEGQTGFCGARICREGQVVAGNYGRLTSVALDPIEKKPLKMFHPGSMILSLGSYGCNLRCPFCQNSSISWSQKAFEFKERAEYYEPEEIVKSALELQTRGNIGLAFTYNEPLIGYEFVRDTARLAKDAGLQNVLVTNGTASDIFSKYPVPIAAKTGTAENIGTDNVTFIAYAPYEKPEVAVAVVVEHGAEGKYSMGIAKEMLDAYFRSTGRIKEQPKNNTSSKTSSVTSGAADPVSSLN